MKNQIRRQGKLLELPDDTFSICYYDRVEFGNETSGTKMVYKNFKDHFSAMIFVKNNNIVLEK